MRERVLVSALLVLLTLGVFAQVRSHEFVDHDDYQYIVDNPHLRQGLSWAAAVRAFTTPHHLNWTPLSTLSLHADHELHGAAPAGYLLGNLALHAAAALLLFLALDAMTGATGRSAFVAAVFAIHPLHVESVAWASQRKDVLAGLFFMGALLAHAGYARRASGARHAGVLACLTLGLLSKPTVVSLPFVLLLLDAWPLNRLGRRAVLEKLPMFTLAAAAAVITYTVQRSAGAMAMGERIAFPWRLANALVSCAAYLGDALWPSGLAAFYPHPGTSLGLGRTGAAAGLLVLLSLAALRSARSRPYVLVGWLWFLVTLAPTLGLVQVGTQARADRYTYLPLVGLALAVSWGATDLVGGGRRARRALAAFAAAAVAALAVTAHRQVTHWRDTTALFRHAAAVTRDNYMAQFGIGNGLRRSGDFAGAARHYEQALRTRPRWGKAANNLAWVLATAPDPAVRDAQAAIRLSEPLARRDPPDPNHLDTLAAAYAAAGRFDEAAATAQRAARLADADDRPALAASIRRSLARYKRLAEPERKPRP